MSCKCAAKDELVLPCNHQMTVIKAQRGTADATTPVQYPHMQLLLPAKPIVRHPWPNRNTEKVCTVVSGETYCAATVKGPAVSPLPTSETIPTLLLLVSNKAATQTCQLNMVTQVACNPWIREKAPLL